MPFEERRSKDKFEKRQNGFQPKVKTDEKRPEPDMDQIGTDSTEDIIYGRRPLIEALKGGRSFNKVLIAKGSRGSSFASELMALSKAKRVPVQEVDRIALDRAAGDVNHQGVVGYVAAISYVEVQDVIDLARSRKEDIFVVLTDGIMDPQNLGSIIRTANACGAHGVIVPMRRGAQVSSAVVRASAGAAEHTLIARTSNISQAIEVLKKEGAWVVGTSLEAEKYHYESDLTGNIAFVIGNEGRGLSRLVEERCDFTVKIPMRGEMGSLNAGVAWGVIAYEALRQRVKKAHM